MSIKFFIYFTLFGIFLLVSGGMLGFKIFPDLVKRKIWENIILKENSTQWANFIKFPFPLQFKIYLFNVTNPKNVVEEGEKPIVQEVGPYVYKETRSRADIERNSEGTVFYRDYLQFHFDENASGICKDTDHITILNAPLNSVIQIVEETSQSLLQTLNTALPFMFLGHDNLFITVAVKQYLFDGIEICNKNNIAKATNKFGTGVICSQLKVKAKTSKSLFVTNTSIFFANFYHKNRSSSGLYGVKSGEVVKEDYGKLSLLNRQNYMTTWKDEPSTCNKIKGLVQFPPFPKPNTFLELFIEDICRTIIVDFTKKDSYKGVDGYKFVLRKDTFSSRGINNCYCLSSTRGLDGNYSCPEGVLDMTHCAGAPVFASFPHLLWANEDLQTSLDGLQPNQEDHTSYLMLETNTGTPLKIARRLQFNMYIRPIAEISITDNVTNAIVPILWVEESFELPDKYVDMLKETLINNLKKLEIFKWGSIATGLFASILPIGCMFYYLK